MLYYYAWLLCLYILNSESFLCYHWFKSRPSVSLFSIKDSIVSKLSELKPTALRVSDVSAAHRNHKEMKDHGAETHFNLFIASEHFAGMSPVERHRHIFSLLGYEMQNGLHALSIIALTPSEAGLNES